MTVVPWDHPIAAEYEAYDGVFLSNGYGASDATMCSVFLHMPGPVGDGVSCLQWGAPVVTPICAGFFYTRLPAQWVVDVVVAVGRPPVVTKKECMCHHLLPLRM